MAKTLTIYGIKNCDTMKKARAWLDKHGVAYDFHDYKSAGIERERLEAWSKKVGWETLLNQAGTTFRKLPDKDKTGPRCEEGHRADADAAVHDQAPGSRSRRRQIAGRLQARNLRGAGWLRRVRPSAPSQRMFRSRRKPLTRQSRWP